MNAWIWTGIAIAILFAGYGMYVWGFVDGCEHASEKIAEKILSWDDRMAKKYCEEETP